MSSLNSTLNLIAAWNNASDQLNRYYPVLIYIFGIGGNFLNVLVLVQRPLRSNPSAVFFNVSSIASLIVIVSGLTSRMMTGYAADLTLTVKWICIVRNFVLYTARTVALWMIALATIDRWYSSSADANSRSESNLPNAKRGVVLILIAACLFNAPIIFCYEANLTGAIRGCYGRTYICRVITDLIYAIITTILPLICMIIFGLLTIRHVHRIRSRIQDIPIAKIHFPRTSIIRTTTVREQHSVQKRDRYLLKMLLVQVTLLCLLTCGHAIDKAYTTIASLSTVQSIESAIENFILNLLTLLNFTASAMPFYIYTLTGGSIFRNTLFVLIKASVRKISCH